MRGNPEQQGPGEQDETELKGAYSPVDEMTGALASDADEERLMRSVLENEERTVDDGMVISEAINQGVGSFTPDLLFQNLVQNYRNAEKLFGETLIRALTEYSPDYIKKNLSIPEFRDALLQRIEENVDEMKERGLLDQQGFITEHGTKLAALVLYTEELDSLISRGLGKKALKERDHYGDKEDVWPYRKGRFRFKDVALKQSVKTALRRGHATLLPDDLRAYDRRHKGRIQVIYAMDASGSMRGTKIRMAKRAGIALAFKAIEEKNDVGLIVFSSRIEQELPPMRDFKTLLLALTRIRASMETDLAKTIHASAALFAREKCTKHLLILTDAVPTKGEDPKRLTIEAASAARDLGITISVVGIGLDPEGEALAREIAELGEGRLYRVKDVAELDAVILEDYDMLK